MAQAVQAALRGWISGIGGDIWPVFPAIAIAKAIGRGRSARPGEPDRLRTEQLAWMTRILWIGH